MMPMCTVSTCLGSRLRRFFTIDVRQDPKSCRNDINSEHRHAKVIKCRIIIVKRHRRIAISLLPTVTWYSHRDTYPGPIIVQDLDLTLARASRPKILRRASFWFTATTVDTVPTATHNTTLSPASRALERGRSVREYPTHVSDPMSSLGHAVWRFLLRRGEPKARAPQNLGSRGTC